MSFDVEGARKAGYSDAEIADFLAKQSNFDVAGARGAGYSDAEILQHLAATKEQPRQEEKAPGFVDQLGRQLGLTARAAIGGVGGLANLVADPVVAGINAMGGNLPMPSQALERTMNSMGLPEPANGTERFAQTTARGMVGPAAAAKMVPKLAQNLGTQVVAAGSSAGSSDLAAQMGFGPVGQFVAGMGGGVFPTTAGVASIEALKAAKAGAPALLEPLTAEGRKRIVARSLQGGASDKDAAALAAQNAPEYVPGSRPTLGQASEDIGLGLMEKAVRNRNPEMFAAREAEQDAARQAGLQKSFGTQTDIMLAEQARDDFTKHLREDAFRDAKKVDTRPITKTADTVLKSGAGARQEVERAMAWVKSRLEGERDPERIYAIRQDINDIIAGKMRDPEKASYQLAAGQLKAVKAVLDRQLEKAAPGFKNYLANYAAMTREIDKAALGQDIAAKSLNPMTERLSPAQFTRQFEKRADEIANAGPVASDALTRVAMDMRRSVAPMANGRTPGSDTLQNIVANNMLQGAGFGGGGPAGNAVARGLNVLYKPFGSEAAVQGLLADAFLDPAMGANLLSMQLSRQPILLDEMLQRLLAAPYGGVLGASVANQ